MSFPRYPAYKDSGADWIGKVPLNWDLRRLGYYFAERREKVSDIEYPALSVTKHGIVPQLETAAKSDDTDNRKKVVAGDFVINSRSDRKGSSGAANQDGSVSLISTVLRPVEHVDISFIHHLLRSQSFQEEYYRYGKGIVADLWSTNYSEMRNILLAMPSREEQSAIASFLDRETAKIDALVSEQQRLIELLKEKRQAVISHAVTKGVNPDAPMKPSGVEWLGDVPAHWKVTTVRRCASSVLTGGTPTSSTLLQDDDEFLWYTPGDFGEELRLRVSARNVPRTAVEAGEVKVFPEGSVLVVSIGATLGKVGYSELPCSANQQINAIVPIAAIDGYFLALSLSAKSIVMRFLSNASTIGIMNQEKTKEIPIVVPPLDEQLAIATILDIQLQGIDSLRAEASHVIDLLSERRAVLISAAVTGQIDVRELADAEAA